VQWRQLHSGAGCERQDWRFERQRLAILYRRRRQCGRKLVEHNNQAALIIDNPRKCGETGATYIPALGRYVLVAWYYPGDPNIETDESHFIFYESPKPWGPWTPVCEYTSRPQGWYCPRVLSKWQVRRRK
jgi:hypothetical protein